ncbi:putative ribonuclease H-like domain-containing protein [Tanacetum coccineum]|uniref:Ribonuclease H-like domain-containing protein n=1 Tax=Tanacetum coccineum TaxID=301880 RepID=A0ABQ5J0X8_9ASTR
MLPRAVLMKYGLVSVNIARQVNTAHSKTTLNAARPMSYISKTTHSTVKNPIHKNTSFKNSNINQRINTVRGKNINIAKPKVVVNAVQGNNLNAIQDQGVNDSGCSRHMTGNMSYLTDYEEIDGGYVAFGGNPKGGKIIGKVPRKNNMYSVDLKNIVPKGGLTCLFAKATSDESKLWHRRLGHLNFKTMNKLVKENLHRASCKSKTSIEIPFDLNMPALEDVSIFDSSRDDEDDGAKADMNNLDTTIQVSPIPTTRIHKDRPLDQVIGDLQSATNGYKTLIDPTRLR